jgi:hypothetical protein
MSELECIFESNTLGRIKKIFFLGLIRLLNSLPSVLLCAGNAPLTLDMKNDEANKKTKERIDHQYIAFCIYCMETKFEMNIR